MTRKRSSLIWRPAVLAAALASLALAAPASASHQTGGYLTANITTDGHITGTFNYGERDTCTLNDPFFPDENVVVVAPGGAEAYLPSEGSTVFCGPSNLSAEMTYNGVLSEMFGDPPDGQYTVYYTDCCRSTPIVNYADENAAESLYIEAAVNKTGTTPASTPEYDHEVPHWVVEGEEYSASVAATDPDGGAVELSSRAGTSWGPDTDVISLSESGDVSVPGTDTAAMGADARFEYRVRAQDPDGNYSERSELVRIAIDNEAPVISDLGDAYRVAPGQTKTVDFTVSDPNESQSPWVYSDDAPSWADVTGEGNPGTAQLTLSPPADTEPGVITINVIAEDGDPDNPLTATKAVEVTIDATPPAVPVIESAPAEHASTTTIGFAQDPEEGTLSECRVDEGEWAECTSPYQPELADGKHTVDIRSYDTVDNRSEAVSHTWTLDTVRPDKPVIVAAPEEKTASTSARIEFSGEAAGTYECRGSTGDWYVCTSPVELSDLALGQHTLLVRQVDLAGNLGFERSIEWTVVEKPVVVEDTKGTVSVAATISKVVTAERTGATVGCKVTGAALRSCKVDAWLLAAAGQPGVNARGARPVKIGSGRVTYKGDTRTRAAVRVKLNRTGRRLLARSVGGLRVRFDVTATPTQGEPVQAKATGRLVLRRQLITPADSLFALASAKLSPKAKRLLGRVARGLGDARSVTCVGHTDSLGGAAANERLGLARAKAVCRYLRSQGARGASRVASRGERNPRASNASRKGRALNRRVELRVTY